MRLPLVLLALVFALRPAEAVLAANGDDRLVASSEFLSTQGQAYALEIASNGDAYAAFDIADPVTNGEIRIYRSTNQGQTWTLWATMGDPDPASAYHTPDIHIAEGTQNRLYLACSHASTGNPQSLEVSYAPLGGATGTFTTVTVMSQAGVTFQYPSLTSDAVSNANYKLYLVAQGYAADGADIWFARSTTFGASWEAKYTIASVSTSLSDDAYPQIAYGEGGVIHAVWEEDRRSGATDHGVFARRALNDAAAGLADWQAPVTLAGTTNGVHEVAPAIAASHSGTQVLASYSRIKLPENSSQPVLVRLSSDGGVTWPAADSLALPGAVSCGLLALPAGQGFRAVYEKFGNYYLAASANATPLALADQGAITDRPYDDTSTEAADIDFDPTQANTIAALWTISHAEPVLDSLLFDSAVRTGVGVEESPVRAGIALHAPVPNPARGWLAFAFDLPAAGSVRFVISDVKHRPVRTLASRDLDAGPHQVVWDGRDERGARAPAGVYFAALSGGDGPPASVRRFVLLRP